jgi:fructose-bisphosphate aldolase class 1
MTDHLTRTTAELMTRGRAILATDESIATLSDRLQRAGVAPTAENRRAYRQFACHSTRPPVRGCAWRWRGGCRSRRAGRGPRSGP